MNLQKALHIIQYTKEHKLPDEAINTIRENRDDAVEKLLEIIRKPFADEEFSDDSPDVLMAMFLLSEFKEKRAFPILMQYLRMPEEDEDFWLGDTLTENFSVILANVTEKTDIPEIKSVAEDISVNEYARGAALRVLYILCARDVIAYEELITYLEYLLETYPKDSILASEIACYADMACSDKIVNLIKKAYKTGVAETGYIDKKEFLEYAAKKYKLNRLKDNEHFDPKEGIIDCMRTWPYYSGNRERGTLENYLLNAWIIHHEPVSGLKDILALCSRYTIHYFACGNSGDDEEMYSEGTPKEYVYKKLCDKSGLNLLLNALEPAEIRFAQRCAETDSPVRFSGNPEQYINLIFSGLVFLFRYNNTNYFVMSDEQKRLYKDIAGEEGWKEKRDAAFEIKRYAEAASNLYGVAGIETITALVKKYSGLAVDDDYVAGVVKSTMPEEVLEREYQFVVCEKLADDKERVLSLAMKEQDNVPRYIPAKGEFLKYTDADYFEKNAEVRTLKKLFKECCMGMPSSVVDELIADLHDLCMGVSEYNDCIEVCCLYGISFEDSESRMHFMRAYEEMDYTTRKWENRGFSDKEIHPRAEIKPVKKVKIGRNDPCPCGSGKKYKKCCGR